MRNPCVQLAIVNFQSSVVNSPAQKKSVFPGVREDAVNGSLRSEVDRILEGCGSKGVESPRVTGDDPWVAEPGNSSRRTLALGEGRSVPGVRR